jgi:streptogramin lyase
VSNNRVWSLLMVVGLSTAASGVSIAAAVGSVSGVVTDSSGQPVRGAIVKATQGMKTVARYTGSDGRYRLPALPGDRLSISVDAFGFAVATKTATGGTANFKLSDQMDLSRLNSSELRYLIPEDNIPQLRVYYECGNCHGLEVPVSRSGMPVEAWRGFLPHMSGYRWGVNFFSDQHSALVAPWVAELFGPDGTMGPNAHPDYSKVKHTPIRDAALKATITEYTIPSRGAQPHSIRVDTATDMVWFSDYDSQSNNIYQFNPKSESFREYKIPLRNAAAHTGAVLSDGSYLVGLDSQEKTPIKLALAKPDGTLQTVEWAGKPRGSRVVARDPSNQDVVWVVAGPETWRMNLKTNERRAYQNPKPKAFPAGSFAGRFALPGDEPNSAGYDLTVDSKGTPWVSQLGQAIIFSINPETGETKMYNQPQMVSARGVVADASDNIWFADYYGHKLGMLDTKTGAVTMYLPPNRYASPYGVSVDKKRGFIWYADTMPNNVTRFNLKNHEFVEYPLPTANADARFVGIDAQGRAWYGGFFNSQLGVVDPGDTAGDQLATSR